MNQTKHKTQNWKEDLVKQSKVKFNNQTEMYKFISAKTANNQRQVMGNLKQNKKTGFTLKSIQVSSLNITNKWKALKVNRSKCKRFKS